MAIDDRKQRILMAIVALYGNEGEPVGSNLLSKYFDMAVSSATLRNEMATLTKLGLLEQPHTSAGRVPTAKGYRYYVDHLLNAPGQLPPKQQQAIDDLFQGLDYDPQRLAHSAAKAFSDYLGHTVVATTPRAEDMRIAHYEVLQVGRYTAAVLAVTNAGGVRTRIAKVEFELSEGDIQRIASTLNRRLRFVAEADVDSLLIHTLVDAVGVQCWPVLAAALTLLSEAGVPSVYIEGQQHFLEWPELEPHLRPLMELLNSPEQLEHIIRPHSNHTTILLGDEMPDYPIPGLCFISRQYFAGGGLTGTIAIGGPIRMPFTRLIPQLEYFCQRLGRCMSGLSAL